MVVKIVVVVVMVVVVMLQGQARRWADRDSEVPESNGIK